MSSEIIMASIEGVALLVKLITKLAGEAGMSKEEIDKAFNTAWATFERNNPDDLPDVQEMIMVWKDVKIDLADDQYAVKLKNRQNRQN